MDRRKFIKRAGAASAAPMLLNGFSINALAANSPLMKMLAASDSDRVLVFIQLHGGNDGLNTVIPISNHTEYALARANVAIPKVGDRKLLELDENLPEEDRVGVHPDMKGTHTLYQQKRAAVVREVGYDNMNMSHFRSRDIWFMGGDYDERLSSGWMGRFLEQEYPNYPDAYPSAEMPDPLGLELGSAVSLAFQRENSIPAGISLLNPQAFYNLIDSVGVEPPPSPSFENNHYGDEMKYLTDFELKTNQYALRLKEVYDAGHNSPDVSYPTIYPSPAPIPYINNPLSEQLKIIARLLSGKSKTRIFLCRIGGFDTHADQVEGFDNTYGRHAALLYHLSESVKAFHDDLQAQGLEDKVLSMTFSEFGRRVYSNESYGTDHGKAGPILLFGSGLKGGVYGTNPDFTNLDNGNLRHQFDYRQVYTTVLSDWLSSPDSSIVDTGFGEYLDQKLDLIADPLAVNDLPEITSKHKLNDCYPNPASNQTTFSYSLVNDENVILRIYSSSGRMLKEIVNERQYKGSYELNIDLSELKSGNYFYRIIAGNLRKAKGLLIQR
ncbi:MAG: hypothetical protein DRI95_14380 [Bacteroidetes bacterium]|nr:MAG: hypothetical protein DRI95_14380 [Bacteroidota bacterium]